MPGLVPGIHVFPTDGCIPSIPGAGHRAPGSLVRHLQLIENAHRGGWTWMPGTSPGMTILGDVGSEVPAMTDEGMKVLS